MVADGSDVARLLELSDERDLWLRRLVVEYRRGYRCGREDGYREGWAAAEAAAERAHQAVARGVFEVADPHGPEARASADRRLRAAEAESRRTAAGHWRKRWAELHRLSRDERYVRAAMAKDPLKRDYAEIVALLLRAARKAAA